MHAIVIPVSPVAPAPPALRPYAERETEADATAYVVAQALGPRTPAPTYIAWQGGDGAAVLRAMNRIQRTAKRILQAVERAGPRSCAR